MNKNPIGEKVIETIYGLKNDHDFAITEERSKSGDKFTIKGDGFRVAVNISPPEWIGLDFYWREHEKKHRVEYSINTDLYDLSEQDQRWFADEIESNMIDFLHVLQEKKILVGEKRGRTAIVIPFKDKVVLIRKGRLFSFVQTTYSSLDTATAGGTFHNIK